MTRVFALSVFLAIGLGAIFAIVAPRPAAAQELLTPNPEIEATIGGQLDAFRAGDLDLAWSYASPNIQSLFGSVDRFGQMVQQGYPMVWRPGAVTFIDLQSLGSLTVQRVEVVDQAGGIHYLGYAMIETPDGWKINGVQLLDAPVLGA